MSYKVNNLAPDLGDAVVEWSKALLKREKINIKKQRSQV